MKDRNISILKYILKYCKQVEETLNTYGEGKDDFFNNHDFKDSISMKVFQIGELANNLTKEYRAETSDEINWHEISGMRNHFAHGYIKMDINRIWDTATNDIPVLKRFCIKEIKRLDSSEDKKEGN
ncbi:MAG: DUF86 domain-containing protein [Oscillospiraceae bacterium]|nr:DUF86 domain-containing protein [Oscillospiraceae bacterium]